MNTMTKNTFTKAILRFTLLFAVLFLLAAVAGSASVQSATLNGFVTVNGKTYYYKDGQKHYGWLYLNGSRYYFYGGTGIMATGWVNNGQNKYRYFYAPSGKMATGWVKNSSGELRYFDPNTGIMKTGWDKQPNGCYRYFKTNNGVMYTGWMKNSEGKYRYFYTSSGFMATGLVSNGEGRYRYFDRNTGYMYTGYVKDPSNGKYRYYYTGNGIMATGFLKNADGKYRFFFPSTGYMAVGWVRSESGKRRYFSPSNGIMATGWATISGNKYYFGTSDGYMKTGWVTVGDQKYYLDPATGILKTNTWIDSAHYVDAAGIYVPNCFKGDYRWPLSSNWTYISSYFGNRESPGGIGSTNHKGIDIPATTGTPIYSIESGIVYGIYTAAESGGCGNYILINHGGGIISEYMHMSRFVPELKVGDPVSKGEIIGYVGSTGNSTGPHLHLGIMLNGLRVDPLDYVSVPK